MHHDVQPDWPMETSKESQKDHKYGAYMLTTIELIMAVKILTCNQEVVSLFL